MSKTTYRPGRNRRKAAPGTPGAPFLGVFMVTATAFDLVAGTAQLSAETRGLDNLYNPVAQWLPNKFLPLDCVTIVTEGTIVPATSVRVDANGTAIDCVFPPQVGVSTIEWEAGHPGLGAANGTACGGTLGFA